MHSRCWASTSPGTARSRKPKAAAPARSMRRARFASAKPTTRKPGTKPSRWKPLARIAIHMAAAGLAAAALALPCSAGAQMLRSYVVTGDGIAESLTGTPGDAARGRALVLERTSTCILCHSGPFPGEEFHGDLAPNPAGSGSRWSQDQLRL